MYCSAPYDICTLNISVKYQVFTAPFPNECTQLQLNTLYVE